MLNEVWLGHRTYCNSSAFYSDLTGAFVFEWSVLRWGEQSD